MTAGRHSQAIATDGCLVLVPGLLSGAREANTKVSAAICRLLGFAEQIGFPDNEEPSVESLVAGCLLPAAGASCAAHLTYLKDFPVTANRDKKAVNVLRADPAFQQIDMNNATLGNPLELDLTQDECDQLQQTLNNHFADDGLHFESKDPQRWYCHFKNMPQVTCTPISAAIGRDVARCRPDGADARQWRSKLAEIEMLLFEHPVNTARQQNNKLPVNTLWLWGEGSPDSTAGVEKFSVYSDNFYTQSVCEFSGVECRELPISSDTSSLTGRPALIVIDKFTHAKSSADDHDNSLQWFDEAICNQLWNRLKTSDLSEIVIWCGDSRLFRVRASVKRQLLRRLFYKPQPLAAFLPENELLTDVSVKTSPHTARQRN